MEEKMTDAEKNITNPLPHADLLEEIVRALVDEQDKVEVTERREPDRNFLQLTVAVAPLERGKVIGKKGATLKLLRDLFVKIGAADHRLVIGIDLDQMEDEREKTHRFREGEAA
jgi:predicted RNA-binding protein YlqC (UPF0109 family)